MYIALKNPFRYRSYYFDQETGLYYLNSRYYDPEIGRFINIDDISVLSETQNTFNGLNLFAYCHNNPISRNDEYGYFFWFLIIAIVVGAVAKGVVNGVQAYNEGARGWNVVGAVIGGMIEGAAMSAIFVLGGGIGAGAIAGISFGAGLSLSALIGLTGGLLSYSVEAAIRTDMQWNLEDFSRAGISSLFKGLSTFFIANIAGRLGAFDKTLLDPLLKNVKTLDYGITFSLAKILIGRKYIITRFAELVFKTFFASGIASISRIMIDNIFKK